VTGILLFAALLAQTAAEPVVRVKIQGKQPVLVGQTVQVDVRVLVPNFFLSAPQFPLFEIEGAVVTMPDEGAVNLNDTIGGESYAGVQRSYSIVPQRPGELTLPPARITFKYAKVPGTSTDGFVTLPPETIAVDLPEGADTASGPVGKIGVTQKLDRDPGSFVTGDTLTRAIEVFAQGTQAMMIPPPELEAPSGVRVYENDPVLDDVTGDRGGFLGGRRIDRVTYLFEKPGDYVLPAIDFPWFDPASGKPQVARAPEIHVSVAPKATGEPEIAPEPPPAESAAPPPRPRLDWKRWLWPAAGILAALLLLRFLYGYWPSYVARREAKRADREESEPAYFRRLERACREEEAATTYESLGRWVRRAGGRSISEWCSTIGNPELSVHIERLAKRLYCDGTGDAWNADALLRELETARRAWLERERPVSTRPPALPELNPRT
jgi:hypothetical protein